MKVIFVRHGRTAWNLEGRMQGRTDVPIDKVGRAQAQELGKKLKSLGIEKIISSPLSRARETAEIIADEIALARENIPLDPLLLECDFGKLSGLTKQEAGEKYGEAMMRSILDFSTSYDFSPYGGEMRRQVLARYVKFWEHLKKLPAQTTLVVAHGRALDTFLTHLLGKETLIEVGEYRVIEM